MQSSIQTAPSSKKALWAGRIISALPALFLLMDVVMKLLKTAPVVEETVRLGYSDVIWARARSARLHCLVCDSEDRSPWCDLADRLSGRRGCFTCACR